MKTIEELSTELTGLIDASIPAGYYPEIHERAIELRFACTEACKAIKSKDAQIADLAMLVKRLCFYSRFP